jgi:tRNA(Ile)-lysidine synthase
MREHAMLAPGDRLGVAVSGGADSVALLRLLLELRSELGVVLSVVHFNHKIRGEAADADESFVTGLAQSHGLELRKSSGDAVAHARQAGKSLESAARDLRYDYFDQLLQRDVFSSVATAHTLDDQAETVLMRLLRGSGTRGLAGIYPILRRRTGRIIRPFLGVRRCEVLAYLNTLDQPWCEDATNLDLRHTRNRVRHELVPLLQQDFNPALLRVLGELAEIARAEEEFWNEEVHDRSVSIRTPSGLNTAALRQQPLALQRRLLRAAAEAAGLKLDFEHVESVRLLAASPSSTLEFCELPGGRAVLSGRGLSRELCFDVDTPNKMDAQERQGYEYPLSVPGELRLPETGTIIRASFVNADRVGGSRTMLSQGIPSNEGKTEITGYNQLELLDPRALAPELTVRNWRPGDRYWPARRKAPKKVKELLQKVTRADRATWPVVAMGDQIVWMRGFPPAAGFLLSESDNREGVLIEEVPRPKAP